MSQPIQPSIGRVVLYHPVPSGPIVPAIVTKVHTDQVVNLMVMWDGEMSAPVTSFEYHQPEEGVPTKLGSWHWMPYQLAVASGETQPTKHA